MPTGQKRQDDADKHTDGTQHIRHQMFSIGNERRGSGIFSVMHQITRPGTINYRSQQVHADTDRRKFRVVTLCKSDPRRPENGNRCQHNHDADQNGCKIFRLVVTIGVIAVRRF